MPKKSTRQRLHISLSCPGARGLYLFLDLCYFFMNFFKRRFTLTQPSPNKTKTIIPPIVLLFLIAALTCPLNSYSPLDNPGMPPDYVAALIEKKAVIILMDTSSSMAYMDLKPSRFEAVKIQASGFIKKRRNDFIGLTIFAGNFLELMPPASNHPDINKTIKTLKLRELEDGTAIGTALISAVDSLSPVNCSNKSIILLTDSVNNRGKIDPRDAAEVAKDFNIRVYTIGVGIQGIARFTVKNAQGKTVTIMSNVNVDEPLLK